MTISGGDDPQTAVEVELIRSRKSYLTSTPTGQEQQPDAKLSLPAARVIEAEVLEELGEFGQPQVGVVGHWRLGFGHDVQIRRRIGFHAFDHDQGIAEQLP